MRGNENRQVSLSLNKYVSLSLNKCESTRLRKFLFSLKKIHLLFQLIKKNEHTRLGVFLFSLNKWRETESGTEKERKLQPLHGEKKKKNRRKKSECNFPFRRRPDTRLLKQQVPGKATAPAGLPGRNLPGRSPLFHLMCLSRLWYRRHYGLEVIASQQL